MSPRRWPRDRVGEIQIVASSGLLVIHVIGHDMVEVWLGPDRVANEAVAAALREGVAMMASDPRPVGAAGDKSMPEPLPPGAGRTAMLVTAATLGVIGIAVGVFYSFNVAMVVMLFAAIPVGMALGTQKKDFYP